MVIYCGIWLRLLILRQSKRSVISVSLKFGPFLAHSLCQDWISRWTRRNCYLTSPLLHYLRDVGSAVQMPHPYLRWRRFMDVSRNCSRRGQAINSRRFCHHSPRNHSYQVWRTFPWESRPALDRVPGNTFHRRYNSYCPGMFFRCPGAKLTQQCRTGTLLNFQLTGFSSVRP